MSEYNGPYGLPYQGSKNQLAERIVSLFPKGKSFCDCCCGGGAILHATALSGKFQYVHGYDLNTHIVRLLQAVLIGGLIDYDCHPFISNGEFKNSINNPNPTLNDFVNKYSSSFGYKGTTYCYAEQDIPIIQMVHNIVMGRDYKERWKTLLKFVNYIKGIKDYTELETTLNKATNMEQIRNLKRLESVEYSLKNCKSRVSIYEKSIYDIDYTQYDVIYFDPPYKRTNNDGYFKEPFNYDKFCKLLEMLNTMGKQVFVSEYDLNVTGYKQIAEYNHSSRLSSKITRKTTEMVFSNH